jgi:hypothetical protein
MLDYRKRYVSQCLLVERIIFDVEVAVAGAGDRLKEWKNV